MKVIIVGGSLSGLIHGIMLKHNGHDVTILERSNRDLQAQGAGVGTAQDVLDWAALHDRVKTPEAYALPSNGVRVYTRESHMKQEVRLPMQMCTWGGMYYRLRANFDGLATAYCPSPPQDEPSDGKVVYQMGREVVGIDATSSSSSVIVSCIDTSTGEKHAPMEADLVIGADGAASRVKSLIAPHAPPRKYAGYVAWRGIIPETAVAESTRKTLNDWFTFHVAANEYVVIYPVPGASGSLEDGSRGLNFVWYSWTSEEALTDVLTDSDGHTHRWSVPSGKLRSDLWEKQKQHGLAVFSKEFCEMLEATEKPFVQAISDCAAPSNPGPSFHGGKVLLVGDAQTILRPHTGFALSQTSRHCLELEKRLPELEAAITGAASDAGVAGRWNTSVLEFSHVARLRSMAIGMIYLLGMPKAIPYLLKWKCAELLLVIKNKWRGLTGTQI